MHRIAIEPGRVVLSRQGHDCGRFFIVLSVLEDGYVLMADGLTRKMDHPKKKKCMHLKPKPVCMEAVKENLGKPDFLDAHLRRFLQENGFGVSKALCKED